MRSGGRPGSPAEGGRTYLSGLEPHEVALRFARISEELEAAGVRAWQRDYDEVAVLCFLAAPVDKIVGTVVEFLGSRC
ncbi:MAG: hypothetical protein AAGF11_21880 [Myxococcota bacterium]